MKRNSYIWFSAIVLYLAVRPATALGTCANVINFAESSLWADPTFAEIIRPHLENGVILMMGRPGSGKGTQEVLLGSYLGIPSYSASRMLDESKMAQSSKEKRWRAIQRGVRAKLQLPSSRHGIIFEGLAREKQYKLDIEEIFWNHHRKIVAVINLEITDQLSRARVEQRRICSQCATSVPMHADECDKCGPETNLEKRFNDTSDILNTRLDYFRRNTRRVIDSYRSKNLIIDIDGSLPPQEVHSRIVSELYAKLVREASLRPGSGSYDFSITTDQSLVETNR